MWWCSWLPSLQNSRWMSLPGLLSPQQRDQALLSSGELLTLPAIMIYKYTNTIQIYSMTWNGTNEQQMNPKGRTINDLGGPWAESSCFFRVVELSWVELRPSIIVIRWVTYTTSRNVKFPFLERYQLSAGLYHSYTVKMNFDPRCIILFVPTYKQNITLSQHKKVFCTNK